MQATSSAGESLMIAEVDLITFMISSQIRRKSFLLTDNGDVKTNSSSKPLMILDYYEATLPTLTGKQQLLPLEGDSGKESFHKIRSRLLRLSGFSAQVIMNYIGIAERKNWILADLDVPGDDTKTPYKECKKKVRVAFRQSGTVYVEKKLAPLLSDGQIFVLSLHEWFYAASGQSSSETVRQAIRELLKVDEEYDHKRFGDLISKMLSKWETVQFKVSIKTEADDLETLRNACREKGADFLVEYAGSSYTRPNCGGACTTWNVKELTCAQFKSVTNE